MRRNATRSRKFKHSNFEIWYERRLKEAAEQVRAKLLLDATFLSPTDRNLFSLKTQTDQHIFRVMEACRYNRTMAADMLGYHRRTLQRILPGVFKRLGKPLPRYTIGTDPELVEVLKRQKQGKRMYRKRAEYGLRA